MEEKLYSVSEAVRLIGVESHVLRYWEEELEITVERTKQGYRIYSEENIELFQRVHELKEQGIGLRAIRLLLRRDIEAETEEREKLIQSLCLTELKGAPKEAQKEERRPERLENVEYEIVSEEDAMTDSEWMFYKILRKMIEEAIRDQNEKLESTLENIIRDELDLQLELVLSAMREAAADKSEKEKSGLLDRIRKWYANKKGHPF